MDKETQFAVVKSSSSFFTPIFLKISCYFFQVLFYFLAISAVSGSVFAARNSNPCQNEPPNELRFVNDYAACEAYFFCFRGVAEPTIPCDEGFRFNEDLQGCEAGTTCNECPPDTPRLAVSFLDFFGSTVVKVLSFLARLLYKTIQNAVSFDIASTVLS